MNNNLLLFYIFIHLTNFFHTQHRYNHYIISNNASKELLTMQETLIILSSIMIFIYIIITF